MTKYTTRLLCLLICLTLCVTCAASAEYHNEEAPRSYFPYPEQLEELPDNFSLPDLFTFFDPSADPDGDGAVTSAEEWSARAAELKDMLSYYVYGNRLDPLKGDTTITAIDNNYAYVWNEGVIPGTESRWGWDALPLLPEGAYTCQTLDFSRFGMGTYYAGLAPNKDYVHAGGTFEMPGGLAAWQDGDTWAQHADVVSEVLLPVKTVTICIKDTDPAHEGIRAENAATEGVTFSFDIRYPAQAPTVDGVVRDEKASRNGAGYPLLVTLNALTEEQILTLNENGYAYISVNDSNNPDAGQVSRYEALYPPQDPIPHNDNTQGNDYTHDSGDLMHSGWMVSRAMDGLENYCLLSSEEKAAISGNILPNIDVYSSAITGCSNNGKRAIIGAVYDTGDNGDTRFDVISASDSGGGGLTGFRYSTEGQLFSYEPPVEVRSGAVTVHNYAYGLNESLHRAVQNTDEDQWFADRAQIFTVRPDLADNTPFDLHALPAIFATTKEQRYFITWTAEAQDAWVNTPATVLDCLAAKEVYEYIGQGGNIACIVRDQAHANQDRDLPDLIAVMDHAFYGVEDITRKFQDTLTVNPDTGATNHLNAVDGNGTIFPTKTFESVAAMSRNPYFLPSTYINWSRPDKHVLWTESNSVTEGVGLTLDFHTDADKVELTLTDGETVLTADTANGIASITLTSDQAKAGQYKATAMGSKEARSIEICGWTLKDALRTSLDDNSALGHDVGTGIAFTTPLINYNSAADPVALYMNGEALNTDIYDYDNAVLVDGEKVPQDGYLQPYGATLLLYAGTKGNAVAMGDRVVFSVRNAKLEALQGYTLALDIELEKYDPSTNPSAPRMRFKPTYVTETPQTPVWEPELRQNTPKSGLPAGESYWPILGNWTYDFDENGTLKPIEEIRPEHSAAVEALYNAEITLAKADCDGMTIAFSAPVSTKDFALAINQETNVSFQWAEDAQSVRVAFETPVAAGTTLNAFVFRSVDAEGNMIGAPVTLTGVCE